MATEQSQTDKADLLKHQVSELYGNSHTSSLAIVVISSFLTWILWLVTDQLILLVWYIFTLVLSAIRTLFTLRYKNTENSSDNIKFWLKAYIVCVFISGLGWGSVILFLVPLDSTYYLICTELLICGLVTGSAGSLASLKYGFATFAIPALLPGAFYLILQNRPDTLLIGLSICIYLVFISVIALRIHSIILYSIRKQYASAKLVVEIKEANQQLVFRYENLEKELMFSTKKIQDLQNKLKQKDMEASQVSELKQLASGDDKFNFLLDKLQGGLWDYNLKTGDIQFSSQWLKMLGYLKEDVYLNIDFWKSLIHSDDREDVISRLDAHAKGMASDFISFHRMRSRDGQWVWVFSRGQSVVWDQYGEAINLVCAEINIADPETLWNGKLGSSQFNVNEWFYTEENFSEKLQYVLQTADIDNIEHTLCHVNFSSKNKTNFLSAEIANNLALQFGNMLVKQCMHSAAAINLGSGNFAILLENCCISGALEKAESLLDCIKAHSFLYKGQSIALDVSIGLTPISHNHGSVADTMDDAEAACRIAKKEHRNVFVYQRDNTDFDPDIIAQRRQEKIREVLANKRLHLLITPLKLLTVSMDNFTKIFRLDARLPGFQYYPAGNIQQNVQELGDDLEIACDICTIEMFYDWSMKQTLSYINLKNIYILQCAESSILSDSFLSKIKSFSNKNTPARHLICIGIPEPVFIAHTDRVTRFIAVLKELGFSFALTGFGSANISFDYLKRLPVDYLMLDDVLVKNIDTDETALLTVKYLNEMSHLLNFKTIAISRDSEALQETLRDIGTDYVQDFDSGQSRLTTTSYQH